MKIIKIATAVAILIDAMCGCVLAGDKPADSACASAVIEAESGALVFGKNENERRGPASTTKIMTALVALEAADADTVIKVDPRAAGTEGSSAYLRAGDEYTLEELIFALMLGSANDAAEAIAYAIGGSIDGFAAMMNEKAAEMGLTDTHFENPHGLDGEGHFTTARELALIAREALKNEKFAEIVSTKVRAIGEGESRRSFQNHNRLLFEGGEFIGVKTGFTKKCGRTLVSARKRDGVTLICVTMSDPDDWRDHKRLTDAGFEFFERVTLCETGGTERITHVCGGEKASVTVKNAETLSVTLGKDHGEITSVTELPPIIYAPVKKGDALGKTRFFSGGKEIGAVTLYACEDCERAKRK